MESKKTLVVNAALVEMTATREETLAAYASIQINAASVIVSNDVKPLLSRYNVKLNAASVVGVSESCRISTFNGEAELTAASSASTPTMLFINGALLIAPDAADALASYEKVVVNGHVYAPDSLPALGPNLQVNGRISYYPGDYRVHRGTLSIDKTFITRVKADEKIFVTEKLFLTEAGLPLDKLNEKNLTLRASSAYVSEDYEDALALIDEDTPVRIIPSGYQVVDDSLTLTDISLARYGRQICVISDLYAPRGARALAEAVDGLIVYGTATFPAEDKALYLEKLKQFGDIVAYRGELLGNDSKLTISRSLLDEYPDGITITDCGAVVLAPDLDVETVRDKVFEVRDCGAILAPEALINTLRLIAVDCGHIGPAREDSEDSMDDSNTSTISCATYSL